MKRVLVTGASGQDGQILSYKLARRDYDVIGLGRKRPVFDPLVKENNFKFIEIDLTNFFELEVLLDQYRPDLVFNFASLSSVKESWIYPEVNFRINQELPIFILKWIAKHAPGTKFIQASSSEIFGGSSKSPQTESTKLAPITPYGTAKANAHEYVMNSRSHGIVASSAILYNHESPLRGPSFITRKISHIASKHKLGESITQIQIGNPNATRDWGWAPDYVDAMMRMMDAMESDFRGFEYVISTGIQHSVMDLMSVAFEYVGFRGWEEFLIQNSEEIRKVDPNSLLGDSGKILRELGWSPKVDFNKIIGILIDSEICGMTGKTNNDWVNT